MVEVVTSEEFDKFTKLIEGRLDKMEESTRKSMDARVNLFAAINKRLDDTETGLQALRTAVHKRVDAIEEKSKSFFTRVKEAFEPVPE